MLNALAKNANTPPAAMAPVLEIYFPRRCSGFNSVESANSKLFDALHAELKGYKDNFLFDTLQKPFIRDLVSLFDDLSSMHEQTVQTSRRNRQRLHWAKPEDQNAFLRNPRGQHAENQVFTT